MLLYWRIASRLLQQVIKHVSCQEMIYFPGLCFVYVNIQSRSINYNFNYFQVLVHLCLIIICYPARKGGKSAYFWIWESII